MRTAMGSVLRSLSALLFLAKTFESLSTNVRPKRVIVVGGGIGGLATAARIASASRDLDVLILEKNGHVGGRCGSFSVSTEKGNFRHERGPSLLLLKDAYIDLFRDCSNNTKDATDYGLHMKQCAPAYQVIFEDGDCIELGFPTAMMNEAEQQSRLKMNSYEPNGAIKWDGYMRTMAAYLECGLPNFIEERLDLASFPAFIIEALRDSARAWPLKPHSDVLDDMFESQKMKSLASFQNLYVGLEPYRNNNQLGGGILRKTAPAVFGLLAAIELHPTKGGVYAPIGGFDAVSKAIERLVKELGVEIQCDTTVTKVDAQGVYVKNGELNAFLPADLVIVNADLPFATESLMTDSNDECYDWNDNFDYSSGVIAFHWSVDKELSDLNTHNVFMSAKNRECAKASWRVLRHNERTDEVEPCNFYVHRASKTDPTSAPQGCDAILVLVPCETLTRNEEWAKLSRAEAIEQYKQQFDDKVVARIRHSVLLRLAAIPSLRNLERHILNEVVDTPGTYADQYNVAAGTPFALSHGLAQLSLTRPGASCKEYPNVLFVGASSRPGNGVPLVLIGAKLVAKKALSIVT
jgi:phytoene desaturase (3,4-didehydrolycopene-forming)